MIPLLSIGTTQACWRRPLRGTMDLTAAGFIPSGPEDPGYPESTLNWDGSISGGINGRMRFWGLLLEPAGRNGDWLHFKEIWQILDSDTDEVLLQGYDEGYVAPSGRYAMVGRVTIASEDYEHLVSHFVLMYGIIYFDMDPFTAPGTFIVF